MDLRRGCPAVSDRTRKLELFGESIASQTRLGRVVHEVLGLLEAEARERAHLLDDLDLLVAGRAEEDVELGLLLGLFLRCRAAPAAGRDRTRHHGRRGLDAELLLDLL